MNLPAREFQVPQRAVEGPGGASAPSWRHSSRRMAHPTTPPPITSASYIIGSRQVFRAVELATRAHCRRVSYQRGRNAQHSCGGSGGSSNVVVPFCTGNHLQNKSGTFRGEGARASDKTAKTFTKETQWSGMGGGGGAMSIELRRL
jgi:hypothetical protein